MISNSNVVLVVDDSIDSIHMLNDVLEDAKFTVLVALEGAQALTITQNIRPDIILLDAVMPGIDGFDTTKIIRELDGDYFKKLPIIALTASTLHNEHKKFKESGMDGHVLKPFNPNEIKEVLNQFFATL